MKGYLLCFDTANKKGERVSVPVITSEEMIAIYRNKDKAEQAARKYIGASVYIKPVSFS